MNDTQTTALAALPTPAAYGPLDAQYTTTPILAVTPDQKYEPAAFANDVDLAAFLAQTSGPVAVFDLNRDTGEWLRRAARPAPVVHVTPTRNATTFTCCGAKVTDLDGATVTRLPGRATCNALPAASTVRHSDPASRTPAGHVPTAHLR